MRHGLSPEKEERERGKQREGEKKEEEKEEITRAEGGGNGQIIISGLVESLNN